MLNRISKGMPPYTAHFIFCAWIKKCQRVLEGEEEGMSKEGVKYERNRYNHDGCYRHAVVREGSSVQKILYAASGCTVTHCMRVSVLYELTPVCVYIRTCSTVTCRQVARYAH